MQISGTTYDENQTDENLRVFAELDSQIAAACGKDIDMFVPTEDDPNRLDDIVLPIPKMITDDEYSAIISTMNSKQHEFLRHVLHCFKEENSHFTIMCLVVEESENQGLLMLSKNSTPPE
ncbi:hypothetical protein AVEN_132228-1 [Araneus ventricosus]|uniref:Uncharacterized protein n=1 Tax=Araneus ventricosus TaxID=182803 RepID=A0A4Y2ILK1_ARAVE|nr:hypothetical protein AVEN_132228-1 [Araneus ventricosus]